MAMNDKPRHLPNIPRGDFMKRPTKPNMQKKKPKPYTVGGSGNDFRDFIEKERNLGNRQILPYTPDKPMKTKPMKPKPRPVGAENEYRDFIEKERNLKPGKGKKMRNKTEVQSMKEAVVRRLQGGK